MNDLRRQFLTRFAALGAAVVAGVLKPLQAFAAEWNKVAFDAKTLPEALKSAGVQNAIESKDIIIKASQERSSLRGLQRTFGVERHTISKWIKKKQINSQS